MLGAWLHVLCLCIRISSTILPSSFLFLFIKTFASFF
jgi:hypothetical protein